MKKIEIATIIGLVFTILFGSVTTFAAECNDVRDSVLRLHILANSDSDEDQDLKLAVRDRILEDAGDVFSYANDREDAQAVAEETLAEIEAVAEDEIAKQGYHYDVMAEVVPMYFTTRTYDTITLPAGTYHAVRISIGEAEGANWWCVLYPPMCVSAAESQEEMEEALDEDSVDLVESDPQYEVRFAIVEWVEDIKNWLSGL